MVAELWEQLRALGVQPSHLYLATGSNGTHSGTLAGLRALDAAITVEGISVSRSTDLQEAKVLELTNQTLEYLGIPDSVSPDHVHVDDRYVGPGYGYPTPETMEAIEIMARDEAIILDPVYTGKAMAGLLGHAREGRLSGDDVVVFLHTGGSPALFAYHEEMARAVGAEA